MKYFESIVELNVEYIKIKEVIELCEAFSYNKNLGLPYFINKLSGIWKLVILLRWSSELVTTHTRLRKLFGYLEQFNFWDTELWEKYIEVIKDVKNHKLNGYLIDYFELLHRMNTNAENPYHGKLGDLIATYKKEIIERHKDWDYDVEEMRPLRYDEWVKYYSKLTYFQCRKLCDLIRKEEFPEDVEKELLTLDEKLQREEEKQKARTNKMSDKEILGKAQKLVK
eukprot:TRINITY_DN17055_c0_g1_i5.p1 TRINITY_DN17055_c0_g1~~TRINITY_DN17055_c0_g1_i5.p1  ORF type:complete len:225 (-),score=86.99 TRINITY_DN17055_c0_g1_i5:82-756(-)